MPYIAHITIDPMAANQEEVGNMGQWRGKKWEGEEGNRAGSRPHLFFLGGRGLPLPLPLPRLSEKSRWIWHSCRQIKANVLIKNTPRPFVSISISVAQCQTTYTFVAARHIVDENSMKGIYLNWCCGIDGVSCLFPDPEGTVSVSHKWSPPKIGKTANGIPPGGNRIYPRTLGWRARSEPCQL